VARWLGSGETRGGSSDRETPNQTNGLGCENGLEFDRGRRGDLLNDLHGSRLTSLHRLDKIRDLRRGWPRSIASGTPMELINAQVAQHPPFLLSP
jgi:hypothetical protein